MASARAAVDLDVDVLAGRDAGREVTAITRHHPVRYYPFPGRITGHPSVLEGPEADIVASARALAELEHVHGLDLWPTGIPATCRSSWRPSARRSPSP
jgi:hypothetical protein